MKAPDFDDIATLVVALVVLFGSFYGLLFHGGTNEASVIYGGLIGAVSTYFFQRSATSASNKHTIDAQNNGLQEMRKAVGRIEDQRPPTGAELQARDAAH